MPARNYKPISETNRKPHSIPTKHTMKKKPDETMLTLWMDGELEGDELQHVEAWVQAHPELLAERDRVRAMSATIKRHMPGGVEPPYPEFFNQHILRHIDDDVDSPAAASPRRQNGFWRWFAVPMAAAAMAVCFYMGTQVSETPGGITPVAAQMGSVYTPDGNVSADMFRSADAGATIIVLEGLDDIPDEIDMVGEPSIDRSGAVMVSTELTF